MTEKHTKGEWVKGLADWTYQRLIDVARWVNGWGFKSYPFSEYRRSTKKVVIDPHQQELSA